MIILMLFNAFKFGLLMQSLIVISDTKVRQGQYKKIELFLSFYHL